MADTDFALHTTCPDGHAILFRRKLSIWRLSLDAPAVVLWCYECGLEWSALEHDRVAVAEAVRRATAIEGERRDVSERNLKTRGVNADGSAERRTTSPSRYDAIANAAGEYMGQPIPFVTRAERRANAHRRHARDCGRARRHMLFAGISDRRRRCRGRQAAHSCRRSMTPIIARGPARSVVIGPSRGDRSWWSPVALGVAIVGLLALLWIPQHGFVPGTGNEAVGLRTSDERTQGVDAAIVSESHPAEPSEMTVKERSGPVGVAAPAAFAQPTVRQSPAASVIPIGTSAGSRRANASHAARPNRKGAVPGSTIVLAAQIPAGTRVPLSLQTPVSSTARPGTLVRARVRSDVVVRNQVVIPRESILHGHVTTVERPQSRWVSALKVWEFGKRRGVVLTFTTLRTPGSTTHAYRIRTAPVAGRARSASRRVAIPAALATVGGAILAGPLGAAGGGIATRAVAGSMNEPAGLPRGTPISVQILGPM